MAGKETVNLGCAKKITCEHVCGVRLFAGVKLPWWLVSGLGGRTLHGNDCRCILLYVYIYMSVCVYVDVCMGIAKEIMTGSSKEVFVSELLFVFCLWGDFCFQNQFSCHVEEDIFMQWSLLGVFSMGNSLSSPGQ